VRQGITTPEEVMRATKDQTLGNSPVREEAKLSATEDTVILKK
jgi:hypothetical protein